jgi:replicative DNA helicase
MVVLHQLSNRVEERQDKRPLLGDLRDSGEIGDIADVVMMLYRDEYYNRETPNKGVTELWLRKDRDGNRDVLINLKYDPRQEWFE